LLRPGDESEALQHQQRAGEAVVILEGEAAGGVMPARGAQGREDRVVDNPGEAAFAPAGRRDATVQPEAATAPAKNAAPAGQGAMTQGDGQVSARREPAGREQSRRGVAGAEQTGAPKQPASTASDLAWIYDGAAALGVARELFDRYAEKRWGNGWAVAAAGRKRAIDEVNAFADDPDGFRVKVNAEVEVFS
jgi:hypothetical protein